MLLCCPSGVLGREDLLSFGFGLDGVGAVAMQIGHAFWETDMVCPFGHVVIRVDISFAHLAQAG